MSISSTSSGTRSTGSGGTAYTMSLVINADSSSEAVTCDIALSSDQTPDTNDYWVNQANNRCLTGTCPGYLDFTPQSTQGNTQIGTFSGQTLPTFF